MEIAGFQGRSRGNRSPPPTTTTSKKKKKKPAFHFEASIGEYRGRSVPFPTIFRTISREAVGGVSFLARHREQSMEDDAQNERNGDEE